MLKFFDVIVFQIIKAHNKSEPLFLVVAHSAVHSGNPPEPIRAPDDLIESFNHISNYQRRKFAGQFFFKSMYLSTYAIVFKIESTGTEVIGTVLYLGSYYI